MFSLRTAARCAPRAAGRLAGTSSLRPCAAAARRSALAKASATGALRPALFSTTARRAAEAASSETDQELSAKIESEMMIEEDLKANEQQPASIKDFKDNSPYEIHDTPGQEVVKLVRTYNDEKITVSFSISDITNYDPFNEDPALEDDEMPEDAMQNANQQRGVQSTGGARSAQTQEQMERDMESEEGEEEDMDEAPAPISLSIVVEKPGRAKGALNVEATAQDGHIVVDNVYYYDAAVAAHGASPEGLEKRAGAYAGPPFGSLDEDLQVLLERFLEERGIDQSMAVFVPDYVDAKEQAEYTRWLSSVKGFVDA